MAILLLYGKKEPTLVELFKEFVSLYILRK